MYFLSLGAKELSKERSPQRWARLPNKWKRDWAHILLLWPLTLTLYGELGRGSLASEHALRSARVNPLVGWRHVLYQQAAVRNRHVGRKERGVRFRPRDFRLWISGDVTSKRSQGTFVHHSWLGWSHNGRSWYGHARLSPWSLVAAGSLLSGRSGWTTRSCHTHWSRWPLRSVLAPVPRATAFSPAAPRYPHAELLVAHASPQRWLQLLMNVLMDDVTQRGTVVYVMFPWWQTSSWSESANFCEGNSDWVPTTIYSNQVSWHWKRPPPPPTPVPPPPPPPPTHATLTTPPLFINWCNNWVLMRIIGADAECIGHSLWRRANARNVIYCLFHGVSGALINTQLIHQFVVRRATPRRLSYLCSLDPIHPKNDQFRQPRSQGLFQTRKGPGNEVAISNLILQAHQKYNITQYEELGVLQLTQMN